MLLLPYWISQLVGGLIGAALAKVGDPCWDWVLWLVSDGIPFPSPLSFLPVDNLYLKPSHQSKKS